MAFDLIAEHWHLFAWGVWTTTVLVTLALGIGALIAIPTAFAMLAGGPLGWLATGYVYLFRGTPLLVQLYLIYYGLSQFEFVRDSWFWRAPAWLRDICLFSGDWEVCAADLWPSLRSAWWCALISFSLNSGAYVAEILRGALKNTPKGELEAAAALGLSKGQVRRKIHIPSAFRRALPQYGNEVIFMLHGSAIASVITIQDILGAGRTLNAKYYLAYEGLLTAALLYLLITYLLVFVFQMIEARYLKHLYVGEDARKPGMLARFLGTPEPAGS